MQGDRTDSYTLPQQTPRVGDIWSYRSRAYYVPEDTEEAARMTIRTDAARTVPEELATISILSIRRTPTGRWSGIVKRTRIALTLPEEA